MLQPPTRSALNPMRTSRGRGFGATSRLIPTALDCEPAPRAPVVLLAEDDADFRTLVAGQLRNQGYHVLECSDGRELLRRIESYREERRLPGFDLAICDVYLPGPSGLELLERMNRERLGIPVILVSGFGDFHTCVRAANKRAAAFFPKPVELDRLLSTVRTLLWKPS
jgi:two-component system nitrogen regulation response regulator NtrX